MKTTEEIIKEFRHKFVSYEVHQGWVLTSKGSPLLKPEPIEEFIKEALKEQREEFEEEIDSIYENVADN